MSRWGEIDGPVLRAIWGEFEADTRPRVTHESIAAVTGIPIGEVVRSLRLLDEDGLIRVSFTMGGPNGGARVTDVTSHGMRRLGEWPSTDSVADILPALLTSLANDEAQTDDERSALRRAADFAQSVGVNVISAVIRREMGIN